MANGRVSPLPCVLGHQLLTCPCDGSSLDVLIGRVVHLVGELIDTQPIGHPDGASDQHPRLTILDTIQ